MSEALPNFVVALFLCFVAMFPNPPNDGFGQGLFGFVIMKWTTMNALMYSLAFLNAVEGVRIIFR